MSEDISIKKSYWEFMIVISVILVVALVGVLWFSGYFGQAEEKGFTEKKCIDLVSGFDARMKTIQLNELRQDARLTKVGAIARDNSTIKLEIQADRYAGLLESCRLSRFADKPVVRTEKMVFLCSTGRLVVDYALTDDYGYIGQELTMDDKQLTGYYGILTNMSGLVNMSAGVGLNVFEPGSYYVTSIIYVNPEMPDVYALHVRSVLDTLKMLGCTGDISQEFIAMAGYGSSFPVRS